MRLLLLTLLLLLATGCQIPPERYYRRPTPNDLSRYQDYRVWHNWERGERHQVDERWEHHLEWER